jgi:hypothetical protein
VVCTTAKPGFYSGHTPRLQRLNHVPDQRHAPTTKSAAEALPTLVPCSTSQVTWLQGVIPGAIANMCGLPPAIVSTNRPKAVFVISGARIQKPPLTLSAMPFASLQGLIRLWKVFSAPSLEMFTGKPSLSMGPFMVELFTLPIFRDARTWSKSGSDCRQSEGSPHRLTLNGPAICTQARTPQVD